MTPKRSDHMPDRTNELLDREVKGRLVQSRPFVPRVRASVPKLRFNDAVLSSMEIHVHPAMVDNTRRQELLIRLRFDG